MDRYITEAVDEFLEEMMRTIETLAGNHLFKVDEACVNCAKEIISFSTGWWQDGQKQRAGFNKSDVNSPTAATDSVLITAEINVTEGRGVAAIDAPGAFLAADMDE